MLAYAAAPTARTPPQTEAEAVAASEHLGIGHVRMNGPSGVPVKTPVLTTRRPLMRARNARLPGGVNVRHGLDYPG
jgi:hypothetical protein